MAVDKRSGWFGSSHSRRLRGFYPGTVELLDRRDLPAVVLPSGFTESVLASGFSAPDGMAAAPDGRVFVSQKDGTVSIIKHDQKLAAPFAKLSPDQTTSQGLMSVALDPAFPSKPYVYVYYVAGVNGQQVNRLSRLTADGDVMVPGSEKVLFESQPYLIPPATTAHNGGSIAFGKDGRIYIPTGDMMDAHHAQTLDNVFGKVLRINPDGTIPTDNPYYHTATGINRAIWAMGLRNPFTLAVSPSTGDIFINDVGGASYEEVDLGQRGANYGWPATEGPTTNTQYTSPYFYYTHHDPDVDPGGVAITGGAFYEPSDVSFPSQYKGDYFFADYANGWIKALDPNTRQATTFASGLPTGIVGLAVVPDGRLLYIDYYAGEIRQIAHTVGMAPKLNQNLADQTVPLGGQATFSVSPAGSTPFSYQWRVNGVDAPNGNGPTFTLPATLANNGAKVNVIVGNAFGVTVGNSATLTVRNDQPPVPRILLPLTTRTYRIGRPMVFFGSATDREDRRVPASAYTWTLDLLHNEHVHPAIYTLKGRRGGSVRLPQHAEDGHIAFRLNLTVTDKSGQSTTISRTITPVA